MQCSAVYQQCDILAENRHWNVCHPCGLFPQWHSNNLLLCFGTKCTRITWQHAGQGLELGSESGSLCASRLETPLLTMTWAQECLLHIVACNRERLFSLREWWLQRDSFSSLVGLQVQWSPAGALLTLQSRLQLPRGRFSPPHLQTLSFPWEGTLFETFLADSAKTTLYVLTVLFLKLVLDGFCSLSLSEWCWLSGLLKFKWLRLNLKRSSTTVQSDSSSRFTAVQVEQSTKSTKTFA